tara:strand:+ start:392 stop:664 length:273 start_codon:yes stop_codon:yes gene_type:complete
MDDLGLVEAIDRLGQGVVVAAAHAADRWLDPRLGQAFGVLDRDVLAAAIGVMDESAAGDRPALMEVLFEGVQNKPAWAERLTRQPTMRRA